MNTAPESPKPQQATANKNKKKKKPAPGNVPLRELLLKPKYWPQWFFLGLAWLIVHLPYQLQLSIGKSIGLLMFKLAKSRRHIAQVNIALCFPEKSQSEQAQLVRQIFIDNGRGLIETMIAWLRPPQYLQGKTEFIGFDKIDRYQSEGRGVMLLGAHYSMLDLAGALLSTQKRISVSYRPQDNAVMNYLMEKSRARLFESCLTRKDIRSFIRTLKAGKVLWYAQDQDFGRKNSVFPTLFGIPAATISATSRIAKAGNAVVLPITYFRKADNSGYVITVHEPLDIPSGDDLADAQQANDFLEQQLRQQPSQYLWLHKRFKTDPDPSVKKGIRYQR